jgi:hypothetical protein
MEHTVWYRFTPSEPFYAIGAATWAYFIPSVALYSGPSLAELVELNCAYGNDAYSDGETGGVAYRLDAGVTYYYQFGTGFFEFNGDFDTIQGGFSILGYALPTASFTYEPADPSTYDSIQFTNASHDPDFEPLNSIWDFGDGSGSAEDNPTHTYAHHGEYHVTLTVTNGSGSYNSTSQVISVQTHDVGILRLKSPQTAKVGQTQKITVDLTSFRYPERVRVNLYKIVGTTRVFVSSQVLTVPVIQAKAFARFSFRYKFLPADAGKLRFLAEAEILERRDAQLDNNALEGPLVTVKQPK